MSRRTDRRQFWMEHYQRCQTLGMSLKGYAEQEGLTLASFYSWSKRFKQEQDTQSPFKAVRVVSSADYRLIFPNGLVLEWSGDADAQQLGQWVQALA